jgi:hypothetical protein
MSWRRTLAIREARELDDDAVRALALDDRLGDAELVDAIANDLDRPVDGALALFGRELAGVHLEHQVHAALEVESERDRLLPQPCGRRVLGRRNPFGLRQLVEADRGPEYVGRHQDGDGDERDLPLHRVHSMDPGCVRRQPAGTTGPASPTVGSRAGTRPGATFGKPRAGG